MLNIRLIAFLCAFCVGCVLAVRAGIDGRYWGALSFFAAGVASGVTLAFLDSVIDNPSFWFVPLIAAAATMFSIVDAFSSSHSLNSKEQDAESDLQFVFTELNVSRQNLTDRERKLVHQAMIACNLQGNSDMLDLTVNAQKAISLSPTPTLIDGVNSAFNDVKRARCLDYYVELRKSRADLFVLFEKKHSWLVPPLSH